MAGVLAFPESELQLRLICKSANEKVDSMQGEVCNVIREMGILRKN